MRWRRTNTPAPPDAVILPPLPNENPELRDYYIGHLMDYWNDFRRVTRSRKKPKKAPSGPEDGSEDLLRPTADEGGEGVAGEETRAAQQGAAGSLSARANPPEAEAGTGGRAARGARRATREQLRMRLGAVREWLIEGRSSVCIVHACQENFHVRRRMAQIY